MKLFASCKDSCSTYWKEKKMFVIWNTVLDFFLISATLLTTATSNVAYITTLWQHHAAQLASKQLIWTNLIPNLFGLLFFFFFYNITIICFIFAWQHSLCSFASSDQTKTEKSFLMSFYMCIIWQEATQKPHFVLRVHKLKRLGMTISQLLPIVWPQQGQAPPGPHDSNHSVTECSQGSEGHSLWTAKIKIKSTPNGKCINSTSAEVCS